MKIENKIIIFEGVEDVKQAIPYARNDDPIIKDFIKNPLNYNGRAIVGKAVIPIIGGSICIICICNNNIPNILIHPDPTKLLDWIRDNPNYGLEISTAVALDLYRALERDNMYQMEGDKLTPSSGPPPSTTDSEAIMFYYDRHALSFLKGWLNNKEEFVLTVKKLIGSAPGIILARTKNSTKSGHTEYLGVFKLGTSTNLDLIQVVLIKAFNLKSLSKAVEDSTDIPKHMIQEFNGKLIKYINL